jgi:uncharacterized protein YjbJ (UPF0337 family)
LRDESVLFRKSALFPCKTNFDEGDEWMVNEDSATGVLRDMGGKVQDAVGGLTGDTATQARGKLNQAAGKAQRAYGQAAEEVANFASEQPGASILMAMGFGVLLGFLLGRR